MRRPELLREGVSTSMMMKRYCRLPLSPRGGMDVPRQASGGLRPRRTAAPELIRLTQACYTA
ncbi:uncharacterized protein CC84DRAFT_1167422 [Paraphaeosphaeria sporulosa]|uniref:Uncharacterized protein n=1 Tax=Paraphaeosphaeria sporulosa TaxID=1460663 RepID=A0A177C6K0_9PLEO|nr:uncharacterized protein CC84DRAFT_1167422 [Paraphaeosphaeria sporulosa]OAG02367.1 hypothetical protein CC84DRAFT_1167422 [Paraphaeosphaeria sporulosa]